jgi:hypothetical protein
MMRELVTDADESFLLSVQLTLDAHGIRHVDSIAHMGGETVMHQNAVLVDEADYPEALALIGTLQRSSMITGGRGDRTFAWIAVTATIITILAVAVLAWRSTQ